MIPITLLGNKIFENYAMSTAGDVTSDAIEIKSINMYSLHSYWSGASATDADVLVQASNDGIFWTQVHKLDIGAASGSEMFIEEDAAYAFIRVVFDKNAETTGLLTVVLCGKVK